jgi:hypothetical protein
VKHRLFELSIQILDDCTFCNEDMVANIQEALELHLECMGVSVELTKVSFVVLDGEDVAEA